ncbi:MAG TPA: hypothetical protein DIW31_06390, partial [Bacteroidales bacterium]|nr:hypothetical protein [Bacteroidales bacterium]
MKRLGVVLLILFALTLNSVSQVNGDYQTRASGNWNANTTWQVYNGGWVNCGAGDYPGATAGAGTVNLLDNNTVTVTANVPNSIGSLRIDGGGNDSYLQFNAGFSLTVTGLTYLNSNSNNDEKSVLVDAGVFRTGSIDAYSSGNSRDAYIRISTGNVTVDGDVTLNSTNVRTYILFTGTGTLFVGGTMNGGGITSTVGGGAAAPTSGTVNYNALGAQTVGTYTYYNLTLSGSGAKTTTGVTVNNILSMEETATASVAPTYGAAATLQYNTATNRTAGVEWITPFAATGGVIIDNTGVITMDAAKVFNASIPLNINSGATLATNDLQLTLGGNFVNSGGTFTAGSSPIIITNNSAQSITGFTTTGLISMTKTGGTATLTGNVNGGALTMNGAGTLNLGAGLTHTITGTWTRTNGTLNGGSSTLLLGGSVSGVGGTFTANTSTVEYYGAGLQDVGALTYYKLTISGGSIKTMLGNVIVSNTITLNSGILRTGNFNLTISGNPTNSIQGTLNSTSMVETNGTGLVIRNAAAATPILFPIGSNGNYAPATINSTSATTGTITVTTIQSGALGAKYVERYWDVITTTGGKTITATFQYDPSEITVTPTFLKYKPTAGVWQDPVGTQSFGTNTFTITGTTNITTTTTSWTAGALGTYYSYQTGDWNTPTTWTSDPGGTTQVGSTVPGINDVVVILTGRTVSLPADIATSGLDVTINAGGYLNMSTYQFTSGLEALRGQGTLKLASINFPTVTTNTLVNTGGGTVEYNNATNFNLPVAQTTYNNLTINAPGVVATQMNNLTLNGNLYVKQGTYRINDNTAARRQLTINGDVIVDNGASLTVGDGVTNTTTNPYGINGGTPPFINYYDAHSHRVVINGDFTNNGTVRFTNLTYPVYNAFPPTVIGATTGFATVYFQGATNNTLTCNNTTDFYNLVLDKGIDQTFSLTVYSSAYTNFRLFGANISGGDQTAPATANNPNLKKALWIRTGTLKLQGLTIIPSLSEGTCGDGATPNSDFYIPANGAFVLDGTDVIVLSTADDYREVNLAYGVSGGTGLVNGVGQGGCSSFSILGKLQINNGYFSTRESGGFITWDWASGQFIINGGTVDAKQYRAAGGTGGLASYTQTGGLFILRGRFWRTPTAFTAISNLTDFSTATLNTARSTASIDPAVGAFNLNNAANVFNMSGGTIQIYDVLGNAAAEQKAFEIKSATGNINVTGGTLEVIPTTGTLIADPANYYIESNASLGNFTVNRASGSSVVGLRTYPLTVITNLNITSGDFNANSLDVAIGGNFTISAGTTYTTGTNRTIFNGLGSQTITLNTASPLSFNKLIVNKLNPTRELRTLGTQNTIIIVDSLKILVGIFRTYNNTIYCSGNIENNSTSLTAAGYLVMNSDAAQTISGNGNGIFTNLELNKSMVGIADVTLLNNITINGDLKFSGSATGYKKLDLQDKNLLFGTNATVTGADVNRFAYTKGEIGNASISKIYSATSNSFTFPIGAPSTSHVGVPVYTPTTIGFSTDPTAYGTISVVPVGAEHYATSVKNRCLTYYWHVKSTGFAGIAAGSVNHSYTYSDLDVATGADITENEYVPARFDLNSVTWTNGTTASINTATNVMDGPWLSGVDNIDGDYTAGDNNLTSPFGTPTTYYSYSSGWWGDVANWSLTDHTTSNPPAVPPGASDIVIIGNGHAITLNTNNTVANTDIRSCANLQIEAGASLDIGYNPGCTFTVVSSFPSGNGLFRLTTSWTSGSTYVFPSGDFSDFNVNLGTTELYSTNPAAGTTYWLPNGITSYGNLILSPLGGSNIIFPNNDLLIYGNLITQGQNADSWFCPTWNVTYPTAPTAVVAKTITINGDLDIQGGGLIWYGNGALAQNFVVNGDVKVATLAALYVWPGGGANNQRMSIGGSLINNTDGLAHGLTTTSKCDFTTIPLTFFGSNSASITNTAGNPSTIFSTVIINKGTSQATTLTCDIAGTLTTPVNNWLTLQNGTLIYQRTGDLAITTSSIFTIPGTAGLTVNTPSDVNIANAASNANDLYLNGKLTVINGRVFVGREIGTDNNNNDIEYSGGGLSEIDMQGGSLIVNGQIRMNSASTAGVLMYRQSGSSSVIINGQNAVTSNAKLEIYNPGSVFNMSGTSTLTIVRGGGGNTYGDLYLRPASSSVSGTSTVYFTQTPTVGPVVDVVQNYQLDATVPLNYLTITGKTAATARNATVKLLINPITINGDLTISNANSFFDANTTYNIGVTIKGNLSNSGTYNHYNNTTTFSGSSQSILGTTATSFHNLIVNPVTSLTLNANTIVSNDLTLTSGILICGGYTVNVAGNLINNANYTDINTGVVLNGTTLQRISGTGTFGRLTLNNTAGARLNNNISLTNDLVLTTGIFDINQYLLTLGVSSNITGAPFGPTKMIASDGVFSAFGIKKVFGIIAAPITYTFPIGTATKYTPAILTINNNDNVGWVRINNINSAHPGVFDPSNVLKYFSEVES